MYSLEDAKLRQFTASLKTEGTREAYLSDIRRHENERLPFTELHEMSSVFEERAEYDASVSLNQSVSSDSTQNATVEHSPNVCMGHIL